MQQFREYLEDEGLPATGSRVEIVLHVVKHTERIYTLRGIRVRPGLDFRRQGPRPVLERVSGKVAPALVTVDWYPKIQERRSAGLYASADVASKHEDKLRAEHLAFLDLDAIFFELKHLKSERGWHNLCLSRDAIRDLLDHPDWYRLYIPPEELALNRFERVRMWQEIALALLKKYCDRYYKYRRSEYELPHLEYHALGEDDPNLDVDRYRILVDRGEETLIAALRGLRARLEQHGPHSMQSGKLEVIAFGRHLYEPLLCLDGASNAIDVQPGALNTGERDFVRDLQALCDAGPSLL